MSDRVSVLFFASLAEQLGCREIEVAWTAELRSVAALRDQLCQRGNPWNALRSDQLRCAVNQDIVKMDHPIQPGDEVAFFPPVTGG